MKNKHFGMIAAGVALVLVLIWLLVGSGNHENSHQANDPTPNVDQRPDAETRRADNAPSETVLHSGQTISTRVQSFDASQDVGGSYDLVVWFGKTAVAKTILHTESLFIDEIPKDSQSVIVTARSERFSGKIEVDLQSGANEIVVLVRPNKNITFKASDATSGLPLAGVQVEFRWSERYEIISGVSGADGLGVVTIPEYWHSAKISIRGLYGPSRQYGPESYFTLDSLKRNRRVVSLTAGDVIPIELTRKPETLDGSTASLSLLISTSDGKTPKQVTVVARRRVWEQEALKWEDDGEFAFLWSPSSEPVSLPEGRYSLTMRDHDRDEVNHTTFFEAGPGAHVEKTVALSPRVNFRLELVAPDGSPIKLGVVALDNTYLPETKFLVEDGVAMLRGVGEGVHTLSLLYSTLSLENENAVEIQVSRDGSAKLQCVEGIPSIVLLVKADASAVGQWAVTDRDLTRVAQKEIEWKKRKAVAFYHGVPGLAYLEARDHGNTGGMCRTGFVTINSLTETQVWEFRGVGVSDEVGFHKID